MFIYETKWKQAEPHTVFHDDDLIFETLDGNNKFIMRYMEFETLAQNLLSSCWEEHKCKYIQIVKEWNECTGFNDIHERPSFIEDSKDTIHALKTLSYQEEITVYYGGWKRKMQKH